MSPSDLKYHVMQANPSSHFFDRETMMFFGDTMKNYGVRTAVITPFGSPGEIEVWELYRKRPVKGGNKKSAYFNKLTFKPEYGEAKI